MQRPLVRVAQRVVAQGVEGDEVTVEATGEVGGPGQRHGASTARLGPAPADRHRWCPGSGGRAHLPPGVPGPGRSRSPGRPGLGGSAPRPYAPRMPKGRVEAFSDGVIAILITIMVLELRVPEDAGVEALRPLLPVFLSYVLSFVFLGIYWNNHHHLLPGHPGGSAAGCSGPTFTCCSGCRCSRSPPRGWARTTSRAVPAAVYGVGLLLAALAYYVLQRRLVRRAGTDVAAGHGGGPRRARASSRRPCAGCGIGLAFALPWLAVVCYVAVAMMWLVPDRRLEKLAALT